MDVPTDSPASPPSLGPELLALLADPTDPERRPLELVEGGLVNPRTGTTFPIVDGLPQLLPESARPAGEARA